VKNAWLILMLIGAAAPVAAQEGGHIRPLHSVPAQSTLFDAAKKAEETHSAAAAPARIYTDKDLTGTPVAPVSAPGEAGVAALPTATVGVDSGTSTKDETVWKERMRVLQERLDSDVASARAALSRVNALTDELATARGAQRALLEVQRTQANTELSARTAAAQNSERAIHELHEEARRLGVLPAWVRP
jgi:hypothetical protein